MRKKNYKGRCEKISLSKCQGVCKTYDPIQLAYAKVLQEDDGVTEFWCNTALGDEEYTTDFLCVKANGEHIDSRAGHSLGVNQNIIDVKCFA